MPLSVRCEKEVYPPRPDQADSRTVRSLCSSDLQYSVRNYYSVISTYNVRFCPVRNAETVAFLTFLISTFTSPLRTSSGGPSRWKARAADRGGLRELREALQAVGEEALRVAKEPRLKFKIIFSSFFN